MSKIGRFLNFGSSSEGNCYYIELLSNRLTKPYKLILELGFNYNETLKFLTKNNVSINEIDGVLISHWHSDHSKSVLDFVKRGFNVFAPKDVFEKQKIFSDEKFIMEEYKWKKLVDGIDVLPIPLEHFDNGERVNNFGYIIDVDDSDFTILFVTDTKFIPQDLSKFSFDMILIEANYLEDTTTFALREAQSTNNYANITRYSRLVDSHMSLENLARTLDGSIRENSKPFDLSKTKFIGLLHLSSNKTTNKMYYKEFLKNYLIKTKVKTNVKDNIDVRILKKEGGFL
jgi:phosphoribosyl 1,2-cyclic phosphodiesterase